MRFEILDAIVNIETFASGRGIRELPRLNRLHGKGRWRKRKGFCHVRLEDGSEHWAEVHWYEATGLGRQEMKIKDLLG